MELPDQFRANQNVKQIIKGIVQVPLTQRLGASTHSLGSLFQCLPTLLVKQYFLMSNLPWHSFEPFPHITSLDALCPSPPQGAVQSHEVTSQQTFLQTGQTQSPQPSTQDIPSSPFTSFSVLLWMHSNISVLLCLNPPPKLGFVSWF